MIERSPSSKHKSKSSSRDSITHSNPNQKHEPHFSFPQKEKNFTSPEDSHIVSEYSSTLGLNSTEENITQNTNEFEQTLLKSNLNVKDILNNEEYMEEVRQLNIICQQDWRKISRRFRLKFNIDVKRDVLREALNIEKQSNPPKRKKYEENEDEKIVIGVENFGKDWVQIKERYFPELCPMAIKNRYYTILKNKAYFLKLMRKTNILDAKVFKNVELSTLVRDLKFEYLPGWVKELREALGRES